MTRGKDRDRERQRKIEKEMQIETSHCIADADWVTKGRRVKVNG